VLPTIHGPINPSNVEITSLNFITITLRIIRIPYNHQSRTNYSSGSTLLSVVFRYDKLISLQLVVARCSSARKQIEMQKKMIVNEIHHQHPA